MALVRIGAEELISYVKVVELTNEEISNMLALVGEGEVTAQDLFLGYGDIMDGEIDQDSVEICEKVDGKWRPVR